MRVLVTGAGGFVGRYLVAGLINRGHQVFAGGIQDVNDSLEEPAKLLHFDITDYQEMEGLINDIKPDGIIHLAAQSMVKRSWEDAALTINVNTIGTINLIIAVKNRMPTAKIINIGTSEEYGLTGKDGRLLEESHPCLPQNPYATSKLAAGQLALQLAQKENLRIVHVRPFNHFGPGQALGYAVSDFASQIANIEKGLKRPVLEVGDVSTQRDFTDVRDVVVAYSMLLENNVENGIYNVCSGTPRSINGILNFLVDNAKIPIAVEIDKERFRPSDVPLFIGSAAKTKDAVGWEPKRVFENSLLETLDWWRKQGS